MTVESGSIKRTRNDGFLHCLAPDEQHANSYRQGQTHLVQPTLPIRADLAAMNAKYQSATTPLMIEGHAEKLHVTADSLVRLGIGNAFDFARKKNAGPVYDAGDAMLTCSDRKFSFPMWSGSRELIGIRIRSEAGEQRAIIGSQSGLFIPSDLPTNEPLMIVEGQTDCAAMLDLGFAAVGRPSCVGSVKHLVELIQTLKVKETVIVPDNDLPGKRGAESLCSLLMLYSSVRIVTPPAGIKDARAWKICGATPADVQKEIDAAPIRCLSIKSRIIGKGARRVG